MDTAVHNALSTLRSGGIVRVLSDVEEGCGANPRGDAGRFVLAAQMSSVDTVFALLTAAETVPVFVTTRDRLEQLQIAASPLIDKYLEKAERPDMKALAEQLALGAAGLAGTNAELARKSLHGQTVLRIEWGGVVSCPQTFEAAVDLCRLTGLVPAALVSQPRSNGSDVSHVPTVHIRQIVEYRRARATPSLCRMGPPVRMPTRHGPFMLQAYDDRLTGNIHVACWTGEWREPVLTRVHSECLTGDLLGSLRCDCGPQLEGAMVRLVQEGGGLLLYMRQEGRGIGLINKLRTYGLQDQGFDTVEANEQIGFAADLRDYNLAAEILVDLGIRSIRLLTNNPQKVHGLRRHGISVADRVPLIVKPSAENQAYLEVKREKMGHLL